MRKILTIFLVLFLVGCSKTIVEKVSKFDRYLNELPYLHYAWIKKEIICPPMLDDDILYFSGMRKFFITKKGEFFQLSSREKLFSDNTNCKKIDNEILIDKVLIVHNTELFVGENNRYYYAELNDTNVLSIIEYADFIPQTNFTEFKKVFLVEINQLNQYVIIGLNKDGNIYKNTYSNNVNSNINLELTASQKIVNKNEYEGEIIDYFSYNVINQPSDQKRWSIITDKYIYFQKLKDDKCLKYENIECEYLYVRDNISYKELDIKYVSADYVIKNDNTVYEAEK